MTEGVNTRRGAKIQAGVDSSDIRDVMKQELQRFKDIMKKELKEELTASIAMLMREELDALKRLVSRQQDEIDVLRERLSSGSCEVNEVLTECEMRRERECNVVITGLQESDSGSLSSRKDYDGVQLRDMLSQLEECDIEVGDIRRLGRTTGKRPLLVKLRSAKQKFKLLGKARLLRKCEQFKAVFINPDLTPRQQTERRRLLEELKRWQGEGKDVVLYRNKIVERNSLKIFQ